LRVTVEVEVVIGTSEHASRHGKEVGGGSSWLVGEAEAGREVGVARV